MVGRPSSVLRGVPVAGVDHGAKDCAHVASPRSIDGDVAHAGPRDPQQLRADRGYGRLDGKSCADDLCVWKSGRIAAWKGEGEAAWQWREESDGEAGIN